MREILHVLSDANHPVAIVTKSAHVLRDLDLLAPMAAKGLAKVALSVTTLDRHLARTMEPRASTPERRLDAIAALADAGVPTAVMVAPVIPGVTDHEMETILARAQAAGASEAGYICCGCRWRRRTCFPPGCLKISPTNIERCWRCCARPARASSTIPAGASA